MMKRINYKKIWENYNNKKLPEGYEIHHIDGNRQNNDPKNLLAVTIQEHLDIHEKQKDYGAVQAIRIRMKLTDENKKEISKAASKKQQELWNNKRHNFQKMTDEDKFKMYREVGFKTLEMKVGIHKINSNHELAVENAKNARSHLSREKELEMMLKWKEKVKDSKWWNNGIINKRSKVKPGPEFKEGMKK